MVFSKWRRLIDRVMAVIDFFDKSDSGLPSLCWKMAVEQVLLKKKKISHRQLDLLHESSSPFNPFEPVRVKPK